MIPVTRAQSDIAHKNFVPPVFQLNCVQGQHEKSKDLALKELQIHLAHTALIHLHLLPQHIC